MRRLLAVAIAALVVAPTASAARFDVRVEFSKRSPLAAKPWEYAVYVTNSAGRHIRATVYPQVLVGGKKFDSLGAHYTLLGVVAEPYMWTRKLRGRTDVVFSVTVFAAGTKRVLRFPFRVR